MVLESSFHQLFAEIDGSAKNRDIQIYNETCLKTKLENGLSQYYLFDFNSLWPFMPYSGDQSVLLRATFFR